jgi:hypothetical protein
MRLKPLLIIISTLSVLNIISCGSGSSGTGSTNDDSGGTGELNIKSVSVISSLLNTTFSPYCIYQYGNNTNLIKSDGSGTGVSLNFTTGKITQLSGFPKINNSIGDNCIINFGQLAWYNNANISTVHIFDPNTNTTKTMDLSQTGILDSTVMTTSFDLDISNNQLYANNTFLNDGYIGFSKFSLNNPITNYSQFDNSTYRRISNPVLFGFIGMGNAFIQMYQADITNNLPALLIKATIQGSNIEQQTISITDSNNTFIKAMANATDIIYNGTSIIVTTGTVQPILYNCNRSSSIEWNYTCNKTYTDSSLKNRYKIVRLLGANSSKLYFLGVDLVEENINIFVMNL